MGAGAAQIELLERAAIIALTKQRTRTEHLIEAERATAAEQGRVQRERFLTPGAGYQPGNARMFSTN